MNIKDPRWNPRRFRRFRPGDELNLCLRSELSRELAPAAAARLQELRADGVDRLPVHVVKAPRAVLGAEDAVKVDAPDLVGTTDPTFYVRVEFLELPIAEPTRRTMNSGIGTPTTATASPTPETRSPISKIASPDKRVGQATNETAKATKAR